MAGSGTAVDLVRCLDCGTEYAFVSEEGEARRCPHCKGVGWIALEAHRAPESTEENS